VAGEYAALAFLAAVSAIGLPGPGDSALIAAGLLAAEGELSLSVVLVVAFLGCVAGREIGYWVGSVGGRSLPGASRRWVLTPRATESCDRVGDQDVARYEANGDRCSANSTPRARSLVPALRLIYPRRHIAWGCCGCDYRFAAMLVTSGVDAPASSCSLY
jgi:hypothetical protein